ncbi:hypothetical protein K788_0008391 [Paraburkholderia caribensis MBA4]|uniref:Uncharacterized protein n=1 Tax=Paraburkholderia caribensis MBA4 TaxID=1323664 RepID=A0A0P0R577_9BURK|nr:hypothetical protein K788_0008391 [Paraburkholderia caribensis MBA4]
MFVFRFALVERRAPHRVTGGASRNYSGGSTGVRRSGAG